MHVFDHVYVTVVSCTQQRTNKLHEHVVWFDSKVLILGAFRVSMNSFGKVVVPGCSMIIDLSCAHEHRSENMTTKQ